MLSSQINSPSMEFLCLLLCSQELALVSQMNPVYTLTPYEIAYMIIHFSARLNLIIYFNYALSSRTNHLRAGLRVQCSTDRISV
jgi:hypothetical protein